MNPLIILHEEAIRVSHPIFKIAPKNTRVIFVWDDDYLITANYSFKRLVFIYESICQLPIEIINGNSVDVIQELKPNITYMPATNNPLLLGEIDKLKKLFNIQVVEDEPFLANELYNKNKPVKRFFQYWKNAEKSIFEINGKNNA